MSYRTCVTRVAVSAVALLCLAPAALAQEARGATPPQQTGRGGGRGQQAPPVISPEVTADRKIAFRIYAPQAQAIRLAAGDIPGVGQTTTLTKGENGVWETTIGPIDPGAYRYNFNVDGVSTIDPRNSATSESNTNVWSLVVVPGSEFMDTKNVPHGAVSEVTYFSTALNAFRRMHVYLPPGYEAGSAKYPVFYLLHGAGDSDDAWTTVGRAGFILDNLIAAKKAKPMLVVMPAGHTTKGNAPGGAGGRNATEDFVKDLLTDIVPYVGSHYRVMTDRAHTAIAGLSMGGHQTLYAAFPHLEKFAYVGVYSSGLLGGFPELATGRGGAPGGGGPAPTAMLASDFERSYLAKTNGDAAAKKGLKLLWFSTGKDDFLLTTTNATVDLLKKNGFTPVYKESTGGHTWINWRNYLNEFAPQLFQ